MAFEKAPRVDRTPSTLSFATLGSLPTTQGQPMAITYHSYSFAYLLLAAHGAEKRAKEAEIYPFGDCLSMLLYGALSAEALINHVGDKVFPHWEPLKRKLAPVEKFEVVAASCGKQVSWGSRPYQALKDVMYFRNLVVHSQTEVVDMDLVSGKAGFRRDYWPSYCEYHIAKRILEDVEEVVLRAFPTLIGFSMPREKVLAEIAKNEPEV